LLSCDYVFSKALKVTGFSFSFAGLDKVVL